jgi:hypothetical protein
VSELPVIFQKKQWVAAGTNQHIKVSRHTRQESQQSRARGEASTRRSGLWQGSAQHTLG